MSEKAGKHGVFVISSERSSGGLSGSAGQPPSLPPPVAEAPPMPAIDDYLDRPKRAGGSVGHAAFGATWQVDGTHGGNVLLACAATLEAAYRRARVHARAVGMPAPAREEWCRG